MRGCLAYIIIIIITLLFSVRFYDVYYSIEFIYIGSRLNVIWIREERTVGRETEIKNNQTVICESNFRHIVFC